MNLVMVDLGRHALEYLIKAPLPGHSFFRILSVLDAPNGQDTILNQMLHKMIFLDLYYQDVGSEILFSIMSAILYHRI